MNDLDLSKNLPIFLVAIITWGGVFAYMLRMDALTRALEKQAKNAGAQCDGESGTVPINQ